MQLYNISLSVLLNNNVSFVINLLVLENEFLGFFLLE